MQKFVGAMIGVVAVIQTGAALAGPVQTVTLGPRFKANQLDHFELEWAWQVTKLTTEEGAGAQPAFTRSSGRKVWGFAQKIDRVDDQGTAGVTLTFERATIMIEGPDGQADYDSKAKTRAGSADPLQEVFRRLLGSKIKIQLDAAGNVSQLQGLDAMRAKIEKSPYKGAALHHINRLLNDQWLTFVLSQHYGSHVFAKVGVGQVWDRTYRFGDQPFKTTYKLDHLENRGPQRLAVVTYANVAEQKDEPKGKAADTHRHEPPDIRGVLTFDLKTGRLLESDESSLETVITEQPSKKTGKTARTEISISTRQTTRIRPHEPEAKSRPVAKPGTGAPHS